MTKTTKKIRVKRKKGGFYIQTRKVNANKEATTFADSLKRRSEGILNEGRQGRGAGLLVGGALTAAGMLGAPLARQAGHSIGHSVNLHKAYKAGGAEKDREYVIDKEQARLSRRLGRKVDLSALKNDLPILTHLGIGAKHIGRTLLGTAGTLGGIGGGMLLGRALEDGGITPEGFKEGLASKIGAVGLGFPIGALTMKWARERAQQNYLDAKHRADIERYKGALQAVQRSGKR